METVKILLKKKIEGIFDIFMYYNFFNSKRQATKKYVKG